MNILLLAYVATYKYYKQKQITQSSASFAVGTLLLTIITILILDILVLLHISGFNSQLLAEKSILNNRLIWVFIGFPLIYLITLIVPKSEKVEKIELTTKQMYLGLVLTFGLLIILFIILVVLINIHNSKIIG